MPQSPAIVGNLIESALGRRAQILNISEPAPGFLELELHAPAPPGGWRPGHEVQFRITPTLGRRYTITSVHGPDNDQISILVATDAQGPGTVWMRGLQPGAAVTVLAGRHRTLRESGRQRLYLGDSSALGTLAAYASARPAAVVVTVEVHPAAAALLAGRWPHHSFLAAAGQPGNALQSWLELAHREGALADVDGALLLGHAQSIQRQRNVLVERLALPRRAITTRPYWADGKQGL